MAVINFDKNGQAFFDWLLDQTSQEFVDAIEFRLDWNRRVKGRTDADLIFETTEIDAGVRVLIFDGTDMYNLTYNKNDGSIFKTSVWGIEVATYNYMAAKYEVKKIKEQLQND